MVIDLGYPLSYCVEAHGFLSYYYLIMLVSTIIVDTSSSWHLTGIRAGKLDPFLSFNPSFKNQGGLVVKQSSWQVSTRLSLFFVNWTLMECFN